MIASDRLFATLGIVFHCSPVTLFSGVSSSHHSLVIADMISIGAESHLSSGGPSIVFVAGSDVGSGGSAGVRVV